MKGQLVVVRDVNGDAIVRRVWDFSSIGVYIMSEEQWETMMSGGKVWKLSDFLSKMSFCTTTLLPLRLHLVGRDGRQLNPFPGDVKIAA